MKYEKFKIIVVLLIICNNINENMAESTHLYESLSLILKQTFIENGRRLIFYVNYNNASKQDLFYANNFINAVLYDLNELTYKILYAQMKKFVNLKHNEVVLFDNMDSFRYFYKDLYNVGNINLSRTLMFIASITTLDFEMISIVFKNLYHMGMIDIALIVELSPNDIVMLTYFPFTPTSCHDLNPVIINRYLPEQQRWSNVKYFPKKLNNLYGCPLTSCVWDDMPYFSIKYDPINNKIIDFMGMEAEFLKYAAKKFNFSVQLKLMSNDVPKEIYNEGSIFAEVFTSTCDFALGGFPYIKDLDQTSPFSQTNYYFLSHTQMVTNIFNVYTAYEKLAFPFHYGVWYLLIIIIVISSLLICICEKRRQYSQYRNFIIGFGNRTPHYTLYTLAVGANMTEVQVPKRNFARFLLISWLLGTFVLRSGYQSGMYQMLRDNRQRNLPQTIQNVFEQNYMISMTPEYRKYLQILPPVKHTRIFNTTTLKIFPELLKANEPIALIAPYEYFGYFGKVNATDWGRLHLVKERILTQHLTCYVRHHSYLINILNDVITDAISYGFITLWKREHDLKSQNQHLTEDHINTNNLSMAELGAVFMILVWLHLVSVAVFFAELIWFKYGKLLLNKAKNFKVKMWQN